MRFLRGRGWLLIGLLTFGLLVHEQLIAANDLEAAGSRPKRAEPTPAVLGEVIPIEDPSGHALDAFHESLHRASEHHGQARVVWWGASHTAGDEYVGLLRRRLQRRFGDAGPGFVSPVRPFRGYQSSTAALAWDGAWRTVRGDRGIEGHYGFAGFAVESYGAGAWGSLDTRAARWAPRRVGRYEIYFLRQPGGGHFEVRIDDEPVARVDTHAAEVHSGYARFRVRDGERRIEVRSLDDRPVRIFGVSMERDRSGVLVDTVGIPGSRARAHLRWNDSLYREQLRRRRPTLTVLAYGTNESEDVAQPIARYEADLRRVVRRVQQTVPDASCLLVGPSDRPLRDEDGTLSPRPRIREIVEAQRRVAADMGCGFFDLVAFMGGEMSMVRWASFDPPYGRPDHVHFTYEGHARLAEVLEKALLDGYARRFGAPPEPR